MAYPAPEPALRVPAFPRTFALDRVAMPVVAAAIGTLLLTTAETQPLAPRTSNVLNEVLVYGRVTPMGGAWKALIVAVLVVASMLAVFYAWRTITVAAGLLVIIVGAAALLVNLLVLNPALSLLDVMTARVFWVEFAPLLVLPFFSAAATLLLAAARGSRDARLASGVLIAGGAFGFLQYLQILDFYLGERTPGGPGPGRAIFIGLIGSAVTLIAGMIARAENRPAPLSGAAVQPGHGSVLLAKALAAFAVLLITVGNFYQFVFYSRPSSLVSEVLSVIASFALAVAGPVILAIGASLTVLGRRDPDRPFAAGVLISGGILALLYSSYSHVFEWAIPLHGYPGWLISSGDISVGGGFALIVAGVALLVGERRLPADDAPAALLAGRPRPIPSSRPSRRRSSTRTPRSSGSRRHAPRPRAICAPPRTSMTATPAGWSTRW